jgi:hypothetical protein
MQSARQVGVKVTNPCDRLAQQLRKYLAECVD